MNISLSAIEGSLLLRLETESLGIRTTAALLEAARTVKGRKALAAKTGSAEQQTARMANFSDHMRFRHGQGQDRTVRAAGVTTVASWFRNPSRLAQSMKEANIRRKLSAFCPRKSRSSS